jgi:uncharacterized protein DUF4268
MLEARSYLPKKQLVSDNKNSSWTEYSTYAVDRNYLSMNNPEHRLVKWIMVDKLSEQKEAIQSQCNITLEWDRLNEKRACRIKATGDGDIFDKEQWPEMIQFMTDALIQMEKAFKGPLAQINTELKNKS